MQLNFGFGSDNHSGVHPQILSSLSAANFSHAPSYGGDAITVRAQELIKGAMGKKAEAHFLFNGTGANVVGLASLVQSHEAILTSCMSHLFLDECGAPERAIGCKVFGVESTDGKVTPSALKKFLQRRGDQHCSQVAAVSITQPTEVGTVYTVEELKMLSEFTRANDLWFHMDGARLPNACVHLGVGFKEITADVGLDVLSLGGTKNGLMFGEAVVFFDSTPETFKFQRKQLLQLSSKTRFIATQFCGWLEHGLWKEIASHSLKMAQRLRLGLEKYPFVQFTQPTQSNGVFAILPKKIISPLRNDFFFYVWDEHTFEVRLMTTFDTQPELVDAFVDRVGQLGQELHLLEERK